MSTDARLIKTERNAVFELVEKSGLNPTMFTWDERKHEEPIQMHGMTYAKASVLLHADTGYFYTFGYYYDSCSPGGEYQRIERLDIFDGGVEQRWRNRIPAVVSWLGRLKDELEAPDMWGELFSGKALAIQSALTPPETRFTQEQIGLFSAEFQRIEKRVDGLHRLTESQKEAIHDGFEEIKADMKRFGVKDWVQMATGLLFNIMVGSALAPSAARDLYNMFAGAVVSILDMAQKLIQ